MLFWTDLSAGPGHVCSKETSNSVTASPVRPSVFDRLRKIENDDSFF